MKLIERYIEVFKGSLPAKIADDAALELQVNIEEMLGDDLSDEHIKEVLTILGDPRKLAQEYNPQPQYLIGPDYFQSYVKVLQLVVSIVAVTMGAVSIITGLFESVGYFSLLTRTIGNMVSGGISAAVWVTIVFAVIERFDENKEGFFEMNAWDIEKLEKEPPTNKWRISRIEEGFSIFFSVFLLILVVYFPHMLGVYMPGGNGSLEVIPIFNEQFITTVGPLLYITTGLTIVISVMRIIAGTKTKLSLVLDIINNLLTLFFFYLITTRPLLNDEILSMFMSKLRGNADPQAYQWLTINGALLPKIIFIIAVIATGYSMIESGILLYKSRKMK